jgi:hypothetical protein
MNNLYEALEICLKEIEQGADVDTVLFRYPDLADELRPILEASVKAKAMAGRRRVVSGLVRCGVRW